MAVIAAAAVVAFHAWVGAAAWRSLAALTRSARSAPIESCMAATTSALTSASDLLPLHAARQASSAKVALVVVMGSSQGFDELDQTALVVGGQRLERIAGAARLAVVGEHGGAGAEGASGVG